MRKLVAALAIALSSLVTTQAHAANTWGTDLSDLWWNPAENGWGLNIAHQDGIIFMTLFVYDVNSRPKWYVASGMESQGNTFTFTGTLYETTGTYLGGAYNPANHGIRPVGTATLTAQTINEATLSYSVDGVNVVKSIQRQTFRINQLGGVYGVTTYSVASGCGTSSGSFENTSLYTITHNASSLSIIQSNSANTSNCTFSGDYVQSGRMGTLSNGTMACANGSAATFGMHEIEAGAVGILARFDINYGDGCTETGSLSGVRR